MALGHPSRGFEKSGGRGGSRRRSNWQGEAVKTESEIVEGIDEDEIRLAYEAILASDAFQKAHRMRRLFRYLMGQVLAVDKGTISEYTIGIEVFDRNPEDYISEDPAIRVQVGRLRHRLAAYYTDHAVSGDVEITIPVGTFTPVFRRIIRPEKRLPPAQGGSLMVQPIRYIAERIEGQVFASGLYEELLNQLFSSFGNVFMWADPPFAQTGKRANPTGEDIYVAPHRLIEGSLRVDSERIRTSIRMIDSLSRITWARHFDRSVQFGIREQEELAASICHALKEVVSV